MIVVALRLGDELDFAFGGDDGGYFIGGARGFFATRRRRSEALGALNAPLACRGGGQRRSATFRQ